MLAVLIDDAATKVPNAYQEIRNFVHQTNHGFISSAIDPDDARIGLVGIRTLGNESQYDDREDLVDWMRHSSVQTWIDDLNADVVMFLVPNKYGFTVGRAAAIGAHDPENSAAVVFMKALLRNKTGAH